MKNNSVDVSSKFCSICKNKNDREAIVCVHCGATLETYPTDAARTTRSTGMETTGREKTGKLFLDEATPPASGIGIYVARTSKPIFLSTDQEFIIGRKVDETSEVFLDLSKLGGYYLGLSRRHAMIRRTEHGYEVIDLSSSNGTWLNDERLVPHKTYPLTSGSQLRMARMQFFVLYRPVRKTKQGI